MPLTIPAIIICLFIGLAIVPLTDQVQVGPKLGNTHENAGNEQNHDGDYVFAIDRIIVLVCQ